MMTSKVEILSDISVQVVWEDGNSSRYHPMWLRYHCGCPQCNEEHSRMRTISVTSMPRQLTLLSTTISDDCMKITCKEDDHVIIHKMDWLRKFSYSKEDLERKSQLRDIPHKMEPIHRFEFKDIVKKEEDFGKFLEVIDKQGLALINALPDHKDAIVEISELIGPIYNTMYDKIYSIEEKDDPSSSIAFVNVPLEFHQDMPYYESPPGLALLHCYQLDPQVTGGANEFVDCFHVANQLREEYPDYFDTLVKVPATFQKTHVEDGQTIHFEHWRPHISVNNRGKVTAVFWGPQAEGPLQVDEDLVDAYYKAYFKFAELIEKSPSKMTYRLQQGQCYAFNNRRLVHNRLAYQLNGGRRHLRGTAISIDEFRNAVQAHYLKENRGKTPKRIGNQCYS